MGHSPYFTIWKLRQVNVCFMYKKKKKKLKYSNSVHKVKIINKKTIKKIKKSKGP